jgi:hypothetical protein
MVIGFLWKKYRVSLCLLHANRLISWDTKSLMLCVFVRRIYKDRGKSHCIGRFSIAFK